VDAAVGAGLARDGGLGQLTDELVGQVAEVVRPVRPGGRGQAWEQLEACREQIQAWVKAGLTVVKIGGAAGAGWDPAVLSGRLSPGKLRKKAW
jgi:hypothetical protein